VSEHLMSLCHEPQGEVCDSEIEARQAAWLGGKDHGRWVRCVDLDRLAEEEAMVFLNTGRDFATRTPRFYSDILRKLNLNNVPKWTAASHDLSRIWGSFTSAGLMARALHACTYSCANPLVQNVDVSYGLLL
jgi:hypothetical protein